MEEEITERNANVLLHKLPFAMTLTFTFVGGKDP